MTSNSHWQKRCKMNWSQRYDFLNITKYWVIHLLHLIAFKRLFYFETDKETFAFNTHLLCKGAAIFVFDRRITSGLWNWHMAGKFDLYIVGRHLNICSKTPSVLNCKIICFSTVSRFFIHGVMKLSCFVTFWPLWDRVVPWLDCAVGST